MPNTVPPDPEKIIHERARLRILVYLASSPDAEVSFPTLRQALEMSAGNLSIQLKTLEDAQYITLHKSFKDRKPHTAIRLSPLGSAALERYLDDLEAMLTLVRAGKS